MKRPFSATVWREGEWFVSQCLDVDVASQGRTNEEAELMLQEAVELLLEDADETEIRRRLDRGVTVKKLELVHA